MKKYDYDYLNELCNKIDLLEYAEQFYDFQKRGEKYFCSCPKHSDSDPSLCISPDVNLFYCFSCGRKGNLINWMMEFEGLTFNQAVQKVAELTNSDINEYIESETMSFYKSLAKINKPKNELMVTRTILDIEKDYNQRFSDEFPQEWVDEGIPPDELKKYNIRIDTMSNRIVYPVFDNNDNLISIKGRTRFSSYKQLKIMKYLNYTSLGGRLDYFQGMQQARESIKEKNEIIIFEGIKSVMKADSWGYHNCVSAETSRLNDYQIELLISMQIRDVVIAFDKDVGLKKIRENVELLKHFTNVWVIYDRWSKLDEKDSPPDKGEETFRFLYENRMRL